MRRIFSSGGALSWPAALVAACLFSSPVAGQSPSTAVCAPPPPMPSTDLRPPPAPIKPVVPACIDQQTHLSHCRDAELKWFNTAVNQFNADIARWDKVSGDYVDQLNAWTQAVSRYSMCEVNAVNAQVSR